MNCRGLDKWLPSYVAQSRRRSAPSTGKPLHVLLCIADHFEPDWGSPPDAIAQQRVSAWTRHYPQLFGGFRDSDGRPPRHTFFYPIDQYRHEHVAALAGLCRAGFGEVEIHLHHDRDTADNLRRTLLTFKERFGREHGLLARHRRTGEIGYGFVHGNWALDNSCPGGRWCGVNNELSVLRETGCYADFTFPSAPDATQTRKINSIYYASGQTGRGKSHDRGVDAGVMPQPPKHALLLIQGPLLLNWSRRKWRLLPRVENGCLQRGQPPTAERLELWLRARVQVPSRPDWRFVKLHTHGAAEQNQEVLLGQAMVHFHQMLAQRARLDANFHFHYVTAREMYNLVRAAEAGFKGSVNDGRDYEMIGSTAA